MSFLGKCLFSSSVHLILNCLVSYHSVVWVPHILWILPQIYDLQIFFFPFCRLLFHFVSFIVQKLLAWCSHTYCFLLFVLVFNVISKNLLPDLMSRSLPLISSRCFMIWGLTFKSLIPVDFCIWYKIGIQFLLLHVVVLFSHHYLLERLSVSHYTLLAPLSEINWSYTCRFILGCLILPHWSMCLVLCQYMLFLVLQLCNIIWSQEMWCLWLCFFSLLWLFKDFFGSMQN